MLKLFVWNSDRTFIHRRRGRYLYAIPFSGLLSMNYTFFPYIYIKIKTKQHVMSEYYYLILDVF